MHMQLFTKQELQDALQKMDLLIHPYIIFCNPNDKELVQEANIAIGDKAIIEEIPWMESGEIILADRDKIENYYKDMFESFVDYKRVAQGEDGQWSVAIVWFTKEKIKMPIEQPKIPEVKDIDLATWICNTIKHEWDEEDIMLFNLLRPLQYRARMRVSKRKTGVFCPKCKAKLAEDIQSLDKNYRYCQYCGQGLSRY